MTHSNFEQQPTPGDLDIAGLDKASVLAALFNAAAPVGLGFLQAEGKPIEMSTEQAQELIDASTSPDPGSTRKRDLYYDYLYGRPLKLDISGDTIDPWGFDRDNGGPGSAQKVIDHLRETQEIITDEVRERSRDKTLINAHEAMDFANTVSVTQRKPGELDEVTLGADELGEPLQKAVDRVIRDIE